MASLLNVGRGLVTPPYDAEIEYLESTGTQYIDTGILQKETHGYKTTLFLEEWSNNPVMPVVVQSQNYTNNFGVIIGTPGERRRFLIGNNAWYYTLIVAELNVFYNIEYNYNNNSKTIINQQIFDFPNNKVNNNTPIMIFVSGIGNTGSNFSKLLLYNFQLTDGGTIILDLIPVRVCTTGYLYDKVSGQLFGNAGTGNFILGPDK